MKDEKDSKALTTPDAVQKALATAAEMFDLKKGMEGVKARLPQIQIAHRADMFMFSDGSKVETFRAIILDHHNVNAYWDKSYDDTGGGEPPACFSMDGVMPSADLEVPVHPECYDCPMNQFGSEPKKKDGKESRGKACKNMKRIHLLMPNELMPHRLTAPPSSIGAFDIFLSQLRSKAIPHQLVPVELGLKKGHNKDGVEFSELTFTTEYIDLEDGGKTFKFITDRGEQKKMQGIHFEWLPIMRDQPIQADEAK